MMLRIGAISVAVFGSMLGLAFSNPASAASGSIPAWKAGDGVVVEGGGDPRKEGAAPLVLRTNCSEHDCIGSATLSLDATSLRGKRLTWSASLERTPETKTASVWVGVDGEDSSKRLAFVTSFYTPVPGDGKPAQREVSLIVPWNAERMELGVLASGWGEVVARNARLKVSEVHRSIRRSDAVKTVDQAVDIVLEHAWHAGRMDAARLQEVRELARKVRIPEEVQGAIRYLLAGLGDHHSMLLSPDLASDFRNKTTPAIEPEVKLEEGGIGYVRVPAVTGANEEAGRRIATELATRIAAVAKQGARNWVVDLRSCGGGNMWPMLAGLHPFLGDGVLGFFRDRKGTQSAWRAGENLGEPRLLSPIDLSNVRVAVLIGSGTASSGEAVAVAFEGRPETRLFGHPTYGVANSNRTFFLRDGSLMLLMTAIDIDREGRAYGEKVMPDETNVGDNPEQALKDALRWLGQPTTSVADSTQGMMSTR